MEKETITLDDAIRERGAKYGVISYKSGSPANAPLKPDTIQSDVSVIDTGKKKKDAREKKEKREKKEEKQEPPVVIEEPKEKKKEKREREQKREKKKSAPVDESVVVDYTPSGAETTDFITMSMDLDGFLGFQLRDEPEPPAQPATRPVVSPKSPPPPSSTTAPSTAPPPSTGSTFQTALLAQAVPLVRITGERLETNIALKKNKMVLANQVILTGNLTLQEGEVFIQDLMGEIPILRIQTGTTLKFRNCVCTIHRMVVEQGGSFECYDSHLQFVNGCSVASQSRLKFEHSNIKCLQKETAQFLHDGANEWLTAFWTSFESSPSGLGPSVPVVFLQSKGGKASFQSCSFVFHHPSVHWDRHASSTLFSCRLRSPAPIRMTGSTKLVQCHASPKPDLKD